MNKMKKGLKVSEVLLISVTVLLAIAILVAFLLYKGPVAEYTAVAFNYFTGILTLGVTLPQTMEVGGRVLEMRTLMFVLVDLFVVVSLIMAFVAFVFVFAKKKWRAFSGAFGLTLTTLLIAFGSGFVVPVLESGYIISRRVLCPIIGVAALVLVTYVASVIALMDEFKGDLVTAALPKEEKKEEPAPAPAREEPKEEKKEEPAPAPAPAEVKVVVEHRYEEAPKAEEKPAEEKKEEAAEKPVEEKKARAPAKKAKKAEAEEAK